MLLEQSKIKTKRQRKNKWPEHAGTYHSEADASSVECSISNACDLCDDELLSEPKKRNQRGLFKKKKLIYIYIYGSASGACLHNSDMHAAPCRE